MYLSLNYLSHMCDTCLHQHWESRRGNTHLPAPLYQWFYLVHGLAWEGMRPHVIAEENRSWENLDNLPSVTVYPGQCQDNNLKPILLQLYPPSVWQMLLDASETKISAKKTTTKTVPYRPKTGSDSSPTLDARGSLRPNIKETLILLKKTYLTNRGPYAARIGVVWHPWYLGWWVPMRLASVPEEMTLLKRSGRGLTKSGEIGTLTY